MDSLPPYNGRLHDIVDDEWRKDELPHDPIAVPSEELPDPEADNIDPLLTVSQQEKRWNDLALASLAPELALNDLYAGV